MALIKFPGATGRPTEAELRQALEDAGSFAAKFEGLETSLTATPATIIVRHPEDSEKDVHYMFDATLSETPTDTLTVTSFPTDSGSTISDHAYKKPVKLGLTVFATNHPLKLANVGIGPPDEPHPNDTIPGADIYDRNPSPYRAVAFYDQLLALQKELTLVEVITDLRMYPNMLITSVRVQRGGSASKEAIKITLALTEINKVSFEETTINPDAFDDEIAALEDDRGRRSSREPEEDAEDEAPATEKDPGSTAVQMYDGKWEPLSGLGATFGVP
jgi:hypothetical protein